MTSRVVDGRECLLFVVEACNLDRPLEEAKVDQAIEQVRAALHNEFNATFPPPATFRPFVRNRNQDNFRFQMRYGFPVDDPEVRALEAAERWRKFLREDGPGNL